MKNSETLFLTGVSLFGDELYWDAIEAFEDAIKEGLPWHLIDDGYLNIAVSYMKLSLYDEARRFFLKVLDENLDHDDSADHAGGFIGSTRARARLGLMRICLVQREYSQAKEWLETLKDDDSHFLIEGEPISLFKVGAAELLAATNPVNSGHE